jgi:hypothetical protein
VGPPFPEWGFGPKTPTLLHCNDCGERTFDPRVGYLDQDGRALDFARLSRLLYVWQRVLQGGAPLAAGKIPLRDPPQEECTNRGYFTLITMFCQILLVGQYCFQRAWPPAGLADFHALCSEFT